MTLRPITIDDLNIIMSQKPKKEYRAPSFPENEERRSLQDRRQGSISDIIQPLLSAAAMYLESSSRIMEQKIEAELKTSEAMLKIFDSLSEIKVKFVAQSPMRKSPKKQKRSENEHHKKVKKIVEKMRKENIPYQNIADHLEIEGIPTFSGRGKCCAQTIHRLYKGYFNSDE